MTSQGNAQSKIPPWLIATGVAGLIAAVTYAAMSSGSRVSPVSQQPVPAQTSRVPVADPSASADLSEWIIAGNIHMDENRFHDAIRLYTHVVERDTLAVNVLVDRGACRHALGDTEGALEDFRKALAIAPLHEIAHFNIGITYYSDGMPDSAAIWWRKLLLFSSNSPTADRARHLLEGHDSDRVVP